MQTQKKIKLMKTEKNMKLEIETDGEWLALYRKKLNLSQGYIANLCKVSVPYISMLENDKTPFTNRIKELLEEHYHQHMQKQSQMTYDRKDLSLYETSTKDSNSLHKRESN